MTYNPTLAAFIRLRAFAVSENASPLDRLTTGSAAAWLAHATCYGITAENEIADPKKSPVERATTLTRAMVENLTAARLPLSPPFQAVDLLYSVIEDEGMGAIELKHPDLFQDKIQRGHQP
ncbi:hypothetical protein [uncultured Pelagimonas sp.]|uniref:hypothetical protein n=1 Tax=uncultured Pelagimonas sp. TaxID=1618102 RepID=UPI0026295C99|nr:hypothetical protein [uncultured Pelagimonas sp.]